jgi:hypothetical protein
VSPSDHVDEDQRVERDERRGWQGVEAADGCQAGGNPGRREHRQAGQGLHRPDEAGQPEVGERLGAEREQGPVGTGRPLEVLHVADGLIAWDGGGRMLVRVQIVQRLEPRVRRIAEDVQREERRGEGEGGDGGDRGGPEQPGRDRRGADQDREVEKQGSPLEP